MHVGMHGSTLIVLLASVDLTLAGVNPPEKCGCAKPGNSCVHNPSEYPDYESKTYPHPGYTRTGYCTNYRGSDPNGGDTHKVCARVSKPLNDWFTSVHNDLRTVVYPGDGWCLCKHWTRGTLCCNDDATKYLKSSDFDWNASLTKDLEVFQIQQYIQKPTQAGRDALCTTGLLSGCTYRRLTDEQKQEAASVKEAWQAKFVAGGGSVTEGGSSQFGLVVGLSIGAIALIGLVIAGVMIRRRQIRQAQYNVDV